MAEQQLPVRPRLRRHLRELRRDDGSLTFRGGASAVTLRGRSVQELLPDLLPLLDGQHGIVDLEAAMPHVSRDVLVGALQVLQSQQLLEEENTGPAPLANDPWVEQRAYWTSTGQDASSVQERLTTAHVLVVGDGEVATTVGSLLTRSGIDHLSLMPSNHPSWPHQASEAGEAATQTLAESLRGNSLAVLCSDVPDDAWQRAFNEAAVLADLPWLNAGIGYGHAIVGPLVIPHKTACLECLRRRMAGNGSIIAERQGIGFDTTQGPLHNDFVQAFPVFFAPLVGVTAASEAVRFIAGARRPTTVGAFLSGTPEDPVWRRHEVLKLPRCAICGPSRYRPQMRIWDLEPAESEPSDAPNA